MFTFIVRSKRDADAVKAMVARFYSGWGVRVATLHGARGAEAMLRELSGLVDSNGYYLVLLGREDAAAAEQIEAELPANAAVHVVPKARVRNARLEQLYVETLRARARLRLAASWGGEGYRLDWRGEKLKSYEVDISFDNFIGVGSFARLVSRLAGGEVGDNPLVLRMHEGRHLVYNGPLPRAELVIGDTGWRPSARILGGEPRPASLGATVEASRRPLRELVEAAKGFLRGLGEFDRVIVPWSGGKDSTAALLLALEAYGRSRVVAVYGDTGTEFPASRRYVEEVARRLGVELHVAYAGLDRELLAGREMPSHENRWCTGLKVAAIERKVSELAEGRTLVIIGDRDAESPRRSDRPPVREGPAGTLAAAPLKPWGGAHVQAYILSKGIPLNPVYEIGFYRIGCYMCPALRNWELYALMSDAKTYMELAGSRIFRRFMHARLLRRHQARKEAGDVAA